MTLSLGFALQAFHGDNVQIVDRMNNLAGIRNFNSEGTAAKIHKMIEVDCYIVTLSYFQNPAGAIVSTIGRIVNSVGHEVHEQQSFCAARKLFRGNNAEYLGLNRIRPQYDATIDRFDNLLSEWVFEPFGGLRIVEKDGRVVDNIV